MNARLFAVVLLLGAMAAPGQPSKRKTTVPQAQKMGMVFTTAALRAVRLIGAYRGVPGDEDASILDVGQCQEMLDAIASMDDLARGNSEMQAVTSVKHFASDHIANNGYRASVLAFALRRYRDDHPSVMTDVFKDMLYKSNIYRELSRRESVCMASLDSMLRDGVPSRPDGCDTVDGHVDNDLDAAVVEALRETFGAS